MTVVSAPTPPAAPDEAARAARSREKQRAALTSMGAAVFLLVAKLVIALATGSLGLLSEALHSGLDLVGAVLSYLAVRVSGIPPDRNHPYGHAKVESLVAMFAVVLLSLTSLAIFNEAYRRIFLVTEVPETTIWSFLVVIAALVVDVNRSRMLSRVARETNSQALAADAAHFYSDLYSSGTVLFSLTLVWLGGQLGWPDHWRSFIDAMAGVIVGLVILRVAFSLVRRSINSLMDQVEPSLIEEVAHAAAAAGGVIQTQSARVRYSGDRPYADIIVEVARGLSIEESDAISEDVIRRVRETVPGADVVVHTHPVQSAGERATDSARVVAMRLGVQIHHVRAFTTPDGLRLDMHMEMPADETLAAAHVVTERYEAELRKEIPHLAAVEMHIEPRHDEPEGVVPLPDAALSARIASTAERTGGPGCVRQVLVGQSPYGDVVTLHVALPGTLSVSEAHTRTADIERAVRIALPSAYRVTVHPEPVEVPAAV